ncbi:hypothetical protein E2C01_004123 [Portunus trituberculatus]|uniref:Uncharacterized protein n=1 Tax=Portunus trituberculatus TaxID=210409 RepID=A0A5B7CT55_PORTR|nr:hypothetical protein [Portunus trituberculatus]
MTGSYKPTTADPTTTPPSPGPAYLPDLYVGDGQYPTLQWIAARCLSTLSNETESIGGGWSRDSLATEKERDALSQSYYAIVWPGGEGQ